MMSAENIICSQGSVDALRPRKILIIAPRHHYRDERVLRSLRAAFRAGFLCSFGIETHFLDAGIYSFIPHGVDIVELPSPPENTFKRRLRKILDAWSIAKICSRHPAPIVYVHESGLLGLIIAFCVKLSRPRKLVIFDYHDWIPYEVALLSRGIRPLYGPFQWLIQTLSRQLAKKVDAMVCISHVHANAACRDLLFTGPTLAVPNCRPSSEEPTYRQGQPFKPKIIFIGAVMRIRKVEAFIELLRLVRDRGVDCTLEVVGGLIDRVYHEELLAKAQNLGLHDNVFFRSEYKNDSEIAHFIAEPGAVTAIMTPTSPIECGIDAISCANKLFTALSLGLPILVESNLTYMSQLVQEHGCGYAFRTLDEAANHLNEIWRNLDSPLWKSLSTNAWEVTKSLNSENCELDIAEFLRSLVSEDRL